ncbi:MAG: hypothetical protein Q9164_005979 [Protoblastenia rupestris]
MARPTMSLPDQKLADLRSHIEPLLVYTMATDKDNKYKASKTTYFAGLAAKPLVTIAILALIVFGLLELKIISVNVTVKDRDATSQIDALCPTAFSRELTSSSNLEFNGPIFSFTQHADDVPVPPGVTPLAVHTVGEIQVRPAIKPLRSSIEVDFTLSVAGDGFPSTALSSGMHHDDSGLTLRTPKQLAPNAALNMSQIAPCVRIHATVWVASGASLEVLNLVSESLAITMHPDLDLNTSHTSIITESGNVSMSFESFTTFASRDTTIVGGCGSVSGAYPLNDILSIATTSGSINIVVLPQDVDLTRPQPADLRLSTGSGSLRSTVSIVSVPNRNYTNFISSITGSVDAKLLHGNSTTINADSASIKADIYPYSFDGVRTTIDTRSQSGSVDVTVNPSLSNPNITINQMSTNHRSLSGTQRVLYPNTWQGTVEASTATGTLDVQWQGLTILEDQKGGGVNERIKGTRIALGGYLGVNGDSGSVIVRGKGALGS